MDEQLRRILDFLRNNKNNYFEAVDTAYHLKLDEVDTENSLVLLQSKKMVTSTITPDGKVVWYAVSGVNQNEPFNPSVGSNSARFDNLSKKAGSEQRSEVDVAKKEQSSWMQIVIIVIVILFLSGGVYLGKWYVDKKFTATVDVAKAAVPVHEYAVFRGKCIQDNDGLQKNIDVLYSQLENTNNQIDSLKLAISSMQQQILDSQKGVRLRR
jgi:hypothetical protein